MPGQCPLNLGSVTRSHQAILLHRTVPTTNILRKLNFRNRKTPVKPVTVLLKYLVKLPAMTQEIWCSFQNFLWEIILSSLSADYSSDLLLTN